MNRLNRKWIPVFVMTVLLLPCGLRAASIQPKSVELNGSFSYQHTSAEFTGFLIGGLETVDVSFSTLDFEPGVGYFLTSHWEILGTLTYQHQTVSGLFGSGDSSSDDYGLKASAYYHFGTSSAVVPFVGIGFGVLGYGGDSGGDTTYTVPEAVVGLRWPVRNVISLNFTGGYRHLSTFEDDNSDADQIFVGAGISVFLSGGSVQ